MNKRLLSEQLLPDSACVLCHGRAHHQLLCPACVRDLPAIGPSCRHCAQPLPDDGICGACQRQLPPYHACRARFRYEYPLTDLILQMKFHGRPGLARALGEFMLDLLAAADQDVALPQALLPMPLHWRRQTGRGYNQALELARPLAAAADIPLLHQLCRRRRATRPQSELSGRARRENVHDAFESCAPPPAHVAIIDDVLTSGHTVAALSRCLLAGGAKKVEVWILARAGIAD